MQTEGKYRPIRRVKPLLPECQNLKVAENSNEIG
jgi:hypothetical protein